MKNGQNSLSDDIAFCSEWLDGPSIVAIKGRSSLGDQLQLGSQEIDWHQHSRGQIYCVEEGLVHISTPYSSWILPPNRIGWVPPNVPHKIRVSGTISGWTIFILPLICESLPESPCVIVMSNVLKFLALRATEWPRVKKLTFEQEQMASIICSEIRNAPEETLHLPTPKTQRLMKVADAILDNPSISMGLEEWASFGAMSSRTLRRLFFAETGLSFSHWRQQAQLAKGLDMLAKGASVTEIADELGYTSPSNFIAMFKKSFGKTPGKYFSGL